MSGVAGAVVGLGLLGLGLVVAAALGSLRRLAAVLRTLQLRLADVTALEPALAELRTRSDQLQEPLAAAQHAAGLLAERGTRRSAG
mgnify:FL=1